MSSSASYSITWWSWSDHAFAAIAYISFLGFMLPDKALANISFPKITLPDISLEDVSLRFMRLLEILLSEISRLKFWLLETLLPAIPIPDLRYQIEAFSLALILLAKGTKMSLSSFSLVERLNTTFANISLPDIKFPDMSLCALYYHVEAISLALALPWTDRDSPEFKLCVIYTILFVVWVLEQRYPFETHIYPLILAFVLGVYAVLKWVEMTFGPLSALWNLGLGLLSGARRVRKMQRRLKAWWCYVYWHGSL